MLATTDRIVEQVRATGAGAGVTVLKEGFLLKRSQKGVVRTWDRRFFTLNSLGSLSYQSAKVAPSAALSAVPPAAGGWAPSQHKSRPLRPQA